jgi:hypothetical protein
LVFKVALCDLNSIEFREEPVVYSKRSFSFFSLLCPKLLFSLFVYFVVIFVAECGAELVL